MLAVDVLDLGAHVRGRYELVDRRVDQHSGGVDPRLVREDVQADARLGWLHRDAAHQLEMTRQVAELLVLEMRDLDAEEVSELHQHLVHRGIAGALSDAVDAGGEDLRSGPEGHDSVPSAQTKIVVEVHDQGCIRRGRFDLRDVLPHREWRVAAHGVRGRRPRATCLQAFTVDLADVVHVGAAPILPTELDRRGALRARIADRFAHHPQVGRAVMRHGQLQPLGFGNALAMQQRLAELVLDVQVGCGREDEVGHLVAPVAKRIDHTHRGVDVAPVRAHHADHLEVRPDLATLAPFQNESQGFLLALRHRGKTDVHDVDPDV